jgi:hypothetical protein
MSVASRDIDLGAWCAAATWRANVRFNRYCKQRAAVRRRLFTWSPAFVAAMGEVRGALAALERVPLLDLSQPRFTIASFVEAQVRRRLCCVDDAYIELPLVSRRRQRAARL